MVDSFGRYEVIEKVAEGSTGTVYRARHTELDRQAAIKELSAGLRQVPGQLERMRAEAETLGALDDPHIVDIYDYVEEPERVWIAEQWVTGAALSTIVATQGRLTPEQSVGVLRGALLGLAHAHERGIVHRDVTTGNILADLDGTSMLVDFGLAAPVGDTRACGTPAYISPEAVRGDPVTTASDVYAAAAVLFELLSGQPPFASPDVATVLRQHAETPAPPLLDQGADLQSLVGRSLDKDPAARPRDAAAFLAELEAAAERRFGAGWLARSSIAGLVAAATAAGVGAAAGGATVGAAAPTVVIDSAAISTGAAKAGAAAGRSVKWPLLAGAAAVVLVGGLGGAVVVKNHNNNDGVSSGASGTTTTTEPSTSPTSTTATEPTAEDTAPGGEWVLVQEVVMTDFQGGKVGETVRRVWTFKPDDCGGTNCGGKVTSTSGSSFVYTWNGNTLVLGKVDPYVYEGKCVNTQTGVKIPGSHFKATRTYVNTPFKPTRFDADGVPTQFVAFQAVKEVTSELSEGCKDRDGVNHARNKMTLTLKRV